jgi:hypothetical protein
VKQFTKAELGKLKGYLKRHLKAKEFRFDSFEPEIIVRFAANGCKYRLNITVGLLEREAPPHYLEIDHATRTMMNKLNNVGKKQPKGTRRCCP